MAVFAIVHEHKAEVLHGDRQRRLPEQYALGLCAQHRHRRQQRTTARSGHRGADRTLRRSGTGGPQPAETRGARPNELLGRGQGRSGAHRRRAEHRSPRPPIRKTSALLANAFAAQYIAFRAKRSSPASAAATAKIQQQIAALHVASRNIQRPRRPNTQRSRRPNARRWSRRWCASARCRRSPAAATSIIGGATPPTSPNGGGLSETLVIGLLVGAGDRALARLPAGVARSARQDGRRSSSAATGCRRSWRSPSRARARSTGR